MITNSTTSSGGATGVLPMTSGPTGTDAATATAGGALGKNEFLKLLVAQMKNQDPLNPMQGDQMAAQLAQFSSLEQLTQMNETLSGQHTDNQGLLGALQTSAGIGTIGHTVLAAGNQLVVGPNGPTNVTVDVSAAGGAGTLTIYDSNGTVVGTRALGEVPGGTKQSIALGSAVDGLPAGKYTYAVTVKDSTGNAVDVQTYMTGKVDGVQSSPQGIILTAGGMSIPYSSVVQIFQ